MPVANNNLLPGNSLSPPSQHGKDDKTHFVKLPETKNNIYYSGGSIRKAT